MGQSAMAALTFDPFVTSAELIGAVANNAAIGFSFAGNNFFGSIYSNNQLYQTDLDGNNVTKFGAPLPIASSAAGEIYVSSSLGLGGFASRSIFAGSQSFGTVWTYGNGATTATAATQFVTGLVGGVRSIAFDLYGNYGGDMLVATSAGRIYRVNGSGVATQIRSPTPGSTPRVSTSRRRHSDRSRPACWSSCPRATAMFAQSIPPAGLPIWGWYFRHRRC
jgi:hypothetical protein